MIHTVSRKQASEMLSVSTKTIDRWIRSGFIKAFKSTGGSKVLIVADSITQENLQSPKPKFNNY
jgi:excisionase family DNA binding protein